jgi:hypothetical protein
MAISDKNMPTMLGIILLFVYYTLRVKLSAVLQDQGAINSEGLNGTGRKISVMAARCPIRCGVCST